MFEAIDEYTARRDGVEVRVREACVSYRRGERCATLPFEYLLEEDSLLIYESAVRSWDASHRGELIGSIERQQILADVAAALDVLGIKFEFRS